ncbi:DMT family transporter [Rhizobium sp. ARZ01]|uniref:DMT family transporter n=1 Tax=Rhizobium sp. ARZ01 TaxID=2769313 RepID=UPI0017863996|nr:DMT family transporter [Rhizobium sp. ARZ01]MBD9373229.1 DMT family transporter [Rhizobium sp. ARZ01]
MTQTTGNTKRLAVLAGLAVVAITAVQFVAARFSLREHLTAADIVSLRFTGASLVFLPIVWRSGTANLKALGWRRGCVLALLTGLPYPLVINWGLTYAPAAHAAALSPASVVFFSFLLSRLVFDDKISGARIVGIGAIMLGLLLFVFQTGIDTGSAMFGDGLFLGSGIMFAAYAVLVRRWALNAVTATVAVVFLSCLTVPLLHVLAPSGLSEASLNEILTQLFIQGFLAGAASIVFYTYAVRQLGPQSASLFMPCIPVATSLTGWVVLGEVLTSLQLVAIVILTLGMLFPTVQSLVFTKRLAVAR